MRTLITIMECRILLFWQSAKFNKIDGILKFYMGAKGKTLNVEYLENG